MLRAVHVLDWPYGLSPAGFPAPANFMDVSAEELQDSYRRWITAVFDAISPVPSGSCRTVVALGVRLGGRSPTQAWLGIVDPVGGQKRDEADTLPAHRGAADHSGAPAASGAGRPGHDLIHLSPREGGQVVATREAGSSGMCCRLCPRWLPMIHDQRSGGVEERALISSDARARKSECPIRRIS